MNLKPLTALAAALALGACAAKPPPPPTVDLNVGISRTCDASPVDPASSAAATIRMSSDGWCAMRAAEADGQPFLLGLVRARPEHGRVLIHKVGGQTRAEYTPNPGYAGADAFTVDLRSRTPGAADAKVQVAVTVLPDPGAPAAAPAPAPAVPPAAATAPSRPAARPTRPSTPAPRPASRS